MFGIRRPSADISWKSFEDDFILGACSRRIFGFAHRGADGEWSAFDDDARKSRASAHAGRTLTGQTTEAFYNSLSHADALSFGLNCALGPDLLRPYVEEMSRVSATYVSVHANAGLPNAFGGYDDRKTALHHKRQSLRNVTHMLRRNCQDNGAR